MVGNWALRRQTSLVVVWAFAIIVMVGLGGCGSQQQEKETDPTRLSVAQLEQANRTFAQLRQESSLRRNRKVLDLAGALLDHYTAFERNDEVLDLAVTAAVNLKEWGQARSLAEELLIKFPDSPLVSRNLLVSAKIAASEGDSFAAANYLVLHYDRNPDSGALSDGSFPGDPYLDALSTDELGTLMETNSGSKLWPYLGFQRANKLAEADDFDSAGQVLAELQSGAPDSNWTTATLQMLGGEEAGTGLASGETKAPVRPDQIGILCPLTGRFAVYGNAFFDAALLARDAIINETGHGFELKVEDTANDPVTAALAARKLCAEEGSIALLGGLRSSPTSCAALVADQHGVPLVSPTAENHHIWELGSGVFQTNLTDLYEIRLLARMGCTVMLKQRFAILYPTDENGRGANQARLFQAEVEKFGGTVVAVVGYSTGSSDFRKEILEIIGHRPEVIFAPATVDQMAQLAPQLDFNHAGTVILGLSNLNSDKLVKRAGDVLERAIFPSDVAVFPEHWVNDFRSQWKADHYEAGVTKIAQQVYLAMRLLLETIDSSGATNSSQVSEALDRRLAAQSVDDTGPEMYSGMMRTISNGSLAGFLADIYLDGWEMTEEAAALLLEEMEFGTEPVDETGSVPIPENPGNG